MLRIKTIAGILLCMIICFYGTPAAAQPSADPAESHGDYYVFMDMQYPSVTQVPASQRVLTDTTATEELQRFTYISRTAAADLNQYAILLFKNGFYFSSAFVDFSAPGQFLAMQYPDTENNIFRNIKMEYKIEGYVITIWAGYDMYIWPDI